MIVGRKRIINSVDDDGMMKGKEPVPNEYIRYLTKDTEPFDPMDLARATEGIVCDSGKRKYTSFYATGVYGGIATGYTVGCCLRCYYCWVNWSRDFPERHGEFYSPEEAFSRLKATTAKSGVRKMRVSGAEPTLCKEHLLALLELVEESDIDLFILETNGILLGSSRDYVRSIAKFEKPHIRVSIKAGTPEGFTDRTGAIPEAYDLPFKALEYLREEGASFHVAAMTDPRIMPEEERIEILKKLLTIDEGLARRLEEEIVDPYDTTLERLRHRGIGLKWPKRK